MKELIVIFSIISSIVMESFYIFISDNCKYKNSSDKKKTVSILGKSEIKQKSSKLKVVIVVD